MIDTAFAFLAAWWPLMALPGAALAGLAMGLWFGREDRLQLKRSWERAIAYHAETKGKAEVLSNLCDGYAATIATYKRDWQAIRAIVEQHTVQQEKA